MNTIKRLQQITSRLHEVRDKMLRIEAENARLRAANTDLEEQLTASADALATARNNILEHAPATEEQEQQGVLATTDHDIRQQIDHYLSEIDKCMEWLRQQ
ncbi:MAG: hypothetical protein AAGJ82_11915 [Bacteroidota bacterium]